MIINIIIHTFLYRRKVVTSDAIKTMLYDTSCALSATSKPITNNISNRLSSVRGQLAHPWRRHRGQRERTPCGRTRSAGGGGGAHMIPIGG